MVKDYTKDWIVAYKGTIIYPSEVHKLGSIEKVKKESYGESLNCYSYLLVVMEDWGFNS